MLKRGFQNGRRQNLTTEEMQVPHEIFEILTRLPVKSLCRFRCVSKLWNSTISDPHCVKSHHHHSLTRPVDSTTLLITFPDESTNLRSLYALDHKRNPDAVHQINLCSCSLHASTISESVNGLICLKDYEVIKICNPSTREFITLPPPHTESAEKFYSSSLSVTSFGYDPTNDQHKVLHTIQSRKKDMMTTENWVFVLGCAWWRRTVDGPPHIPNKKDCVCFNGAIYYRGIITNQGHRHSQVLVEFDVKLETFRFIQLPNGASNLGPFSSGLIIFDGHLGVVDHKHLIDKNTIKIWVLEDSLKPNWVCKTTVFSSAACTDFLEDHQFFLADTIRHPFFLVGTIRTGEIVITPCKLRKPFYLFYLDLKNASVRRVEFRSLPESCLHVVGLIYHISVTDHVESVLSLRGK